MTVKKNIKDIEHPEYSKMLGSWHKFRVTFEGGDSFIDQYLKTFSAREDNRDYNKRKALTYVPAHAKAAVMEVKNAIFQRFPDIKRSGGTDSYKQAVAGENKGVDRHGNTMNGFIGRRVLPDLLAIGKIGVYVDRPRLPDGPTKADVKGNPPYLYTYKAEDILSWSVDPNTQQLTALLLRDTINGVDEDTGLVVKDIIRFRHLKLTDGGVEVTFYTDKGVKEDGAVILNLSMIPFVIFELSHSLLVDIANYQIALLNLSSSDMNYAMQSNYPFYTEQFEPMADQSYVRQAFDTASLDDEEPRGEGTAGEAADAATAKDPSLKVGVTKGRRYPKGLDRPDFIAPPTEPLKASMDKQEQMKTEIKQLINLAVTTLKPSRASAETKREDAKGLEAGLSYVGLELEYGERQIQDIWAMYEHEKITPAVTYPQNYSLRSEESRRQEAKELTELLPKIPSKTYQKEIAKEVIEITLGHRVTNEELQKARQEIDDADVIVIDPEVIASDLENGLVSAKTASEARGYPKGDVEIAQKEQATRAAAIVAAQSRSAARGAEDLDPDPKKSAEEEKEESRQRDLDAQNEDKTRGKGK